MVPMQRGRFRSARTAIAFVTALLVAEVLVVEEAQTALVVPTDVQQPGTQPLEVGNLESPDKCDNCHGGYDRAVEPAFNWRGSMMANAGRDPLFWATVAIAEQDFDGAGDLCIRCHSSAGWHAGRSTPTDGSGLAAGDSDGVDCDTCHKTTNPDDSEHLGVMNPPFEANDEATPATGYYGSGMLSLWGGSEKLGPYADATARHQFRQSRFHRDVRFCGSCHDVSNPVVGNLAPNNGRQSAVGAVIANYILGGPVDGKAAFNNFPFQYGVVERTFSEHMAGALSKTLVSSYGSLPADLKAGAIQAAYDSARGNYSDGTPRFFSCQTCHMRAVTGQGCNKNPAVRTDLPLHDMTGGNTWAPDAILYQNAQGKLRLGGGMTATQIDAVGAGKDRALAQLRLAASLMVSGNTVKVTNLTGHKLISGYPEGRRMWLNVKWYGANDVLLREDGKYGDFNVSSPGAPPVVKTLLDLDDPNTKVYEAHYAMTQEWAARLLELGLSASMPLAFDRATGLVSYTLGQLAAQAPGTWRETFHFVLNNYVAKDNRIPTYGMTYDEARARNALPVPGTQYGDPGPGGTFRYWDEVTLNPPAGATRAAIDLLYQTTSWEYVQFLQLANTRTNAFLADEGVNLLEAWANTGMSQPVAMASATWTSSSTLPVLLGVQSRKTHGGAGTFDLGIDISQAISAAVTAEPRAAGGKLVFQFDRAIASPGTPACVDSNGASLGTATAVASGNDVEVTLPMIADNRRAAVSLANVNGQGVNVSAALGFLVGDVNGSRSVTASDILKAKGRLGQGVSGSNFLHDVDLSGTIDGSDLAAIKSGSGLELMP